MVFSVVYSSTSDHDWTQAQLLDLLAGSRDRNRVHGITGLLLYRDCVFMQVLEGDEHEVRRLFANIVADRRHQDVDVMWEFEIPVRRFAEWSMAFRELDQNPAYEAVGSIDADVALDRRGFGGLNAVNDFVSMFAPG